MEETSRQKKKQVQRDRVCLEPSGIAGSPEWLERNEGWVDEKERRQELGEGRPYSSGQGRDFGFSFRQNVELLKSFEQSIVDLHFNSFVLFFCLNFGVNNRLKTAKEE